MLKILISRIAAAVPLLAIISFLIFSLIVLIPGDPAVSLAGQNPTPAQIAAIRDTLGLNEPFLVRYWHWVSGLLQGDLGHSLFSSQPVWVDITARLPTTVSLVGLCMLIAVVLGVALGAVAGLRAGSWMDRAATVLASIGVAVPYFWVGMLLIMTLSVTYPLFPSVGYVPLTQDPWQWFRHLALPAFALSLTPSAIIARQTRASLVTVMSEDYIRTARAKGLSPVRIVVKHALKNAALPVITVFGIEMSRLLGSTVVIEQLFSLPGIGKLAYDAVFNRDFPVVQGVVLVAAGMVIFINILVDVSYAYFNPRVR
ncbi:ABC transporter permease [Salinisphaera sp. T31B1]|uniref:ABC transporter permease n=1 Tax=Salinisphaera sp. T31B1 TaxID=727963 RepID=UPI0033408077